MSSIVEGGDVECPNVKAMAKRGRGGGGEKRDGCIIRVAEQLVFSKQISHLLRLSFRYGANYSRRDTKATLTTRRPMGLCSRPTPTVHR